MSWDGLSLAIGVLEPNERRQKRSENTADNPLARHLTVARPAEPHRRTGRVTYEHAVPRAERLAAAAGAEAVAVDANWLDAFGTEAAGWFEAAANACHAATGAKRIYASIVRNDVQRVVLAEFSGAEVPGVVNDLVRSFTANGFHGRLCPRQLPTSCKHHAITPAPGVSKEVVGEENRKDREHRQVQHQPEPEQKPDDVATQIQN